MQVFIYFLPFRWTNNYIYIKCMDLKRIDMTVGLSMSMDCCHNSFASMLYYSRSRAYSGAERSCASSANPRGEQYTADPGLTLIPFGKVLA